MSQAYYCQEKKEIALINSEDKTRSEQFRAEMAKAAQQWEQLEDRWLEIELRQGLFPPGSAK